MKRNSFVMFCFRSTAHRMLHTRSNRRRRRRRPPRHDSRERLTIDGAHHVHNDIIYYYNLPNIIIYNFAELMFQLTTSLRY